MHTFTVNDAEGVAHTYELTRHRTQDGVPMTAWVTGHVVEALAQALGDVGVAALEKVAAKGLQGWDAFKAITADPEVMKQVDIGKVGSTAREVVMKLSVPVQLVILRYTSRDGKPLVEDDGTPALTYNSVYPANYPELYQALFHVCRVNGFFPALGALGDAAKAALAATPSTPESEE